MGAVILACILLAYGFFMAGRWWERNHAPEKELHVEVGPSRNGGVLAMHTFSARIVDRSGHALHFKRVDLREDDYEVRLAEAVAEMKQKLRAIEAVQQIAREP